MTISTTLAAAPGLMSEVTGYFREHAAPTDRGDRDVRPGLRMLGARGLLGLGAGDDGGPGLVQAATLLEEVAVVGAAHGARIPRQGRAGFGGR
jgi:hypothetical protein